MMMAASATMLFGACSADGDLMDNTQTTNNQSEIGFTAVSNNATGRASITTSSTFGTNGNSFGVWCFDGSNAYMSNTQITSNGTAWNYQNNTDKRYWTNTTLNFYGLYPYNSATTMTCDANGVSQGFSITTVNEYGTGVTDTNTDILYACAIGQKKNSTNGTTNQKNYVTMHFKHALSQVVFTVKKTFDNSDDHEVTIHSIKIKNVLPTGTYTYPITSTFANKAATDAEATCKASGTAGDVDVKFASDITATKDAANVNSQTNNAILVVPQTLEKVEGEGAKSAIVVEVEYKVKAHGSYLKGSDSAWEKATLDLATSTIKSWALGKVYTYNINITPASDDLIEFNAGVTEWAEASGDITIQ